MLEFKKQKQLDISTSCLKSVLSCKDIKKTAESLDISNACIFPRCRSNTKANEQNLFQKNKKFLYAGAGIFLVGMIFWSGMRYGKYEAVSLKEAIPDSTQKENPTLSSTSNIENPPVASNIESPPPVSIIENPPIVSNIEERSSISNAKISPVILGAENSSRVLNTEDPSGVSNTEKRSSVSTTGRQTRTEGVVEKIDTNSLTIKKTDGNAINFTFDPKIRVTASGKIVELSAIEKDDSVSVYSRVGSDNQQVANRILIRTAR